MGSTDKSQTRAEAGGRRKPQLLLRRRSLQGSHACLGCSGHHLAPRCRVYWRPRSSAAGCAPPCLAAARRSLIAPAQLRG